MANSAVKTSSKKPVATKAKSKTVTRSKQEVTDKAQLRKIQIADLSLSPLNPRQTVDADEITALANSIKSAGLVQNLVGLKSGGKVEIVAGGRRLRALQQIAKQDNKPDFSASVLIVENEKDALLMIGAENEARLAPSPADEIRAYKASADAGHTPEEIGMAFGRTTIHVKGRLKLANLAPVILEALQNREITLDVAAAYTLADSQDEQIAVFEELSDSWSGDNPRTIQNHLSKGKVAGYNRLAQFVTRETYEEAGGTVTEDLFGDEVYFDDCELLNRLAHEKGAGAVKYHLQMGGWSWAEFVTEIDHSKVDNDFARAYASTVPLSDEEQAEWKNLHEVFKEVDAFTDEQQERYDALAEKRRITEYSDAQKSVSGVLITIDYHGKLTTLDGLILAGDVQKAIDAGVLEDSSKTKQSVSDSAIAARDEATSYSASLQDDLSIIRTAAVQTAMLDDEDFAFDALVFSISQPNLYAGQIPFGLSGKFAQNHCADEGLLENKVLRPESTTVPIRQDQINEAFIQFRQLPKKEKMRLLMEHVARCTSIKLATAPHCDLDNTVFTMLDVNPRKVWTPTQSFFKRLKASQLDAIVEQLNGKPSTTAFIKMKKGEKVDYLHKLFTDQAFLKTMHKDMRKRVAEWLPEGLDNPKSNQEPEDKITSLKAA